MGINFEQIGKLIGEEIGFEPGPCLYPGKFKPPHLGHWDVAKDLAGRNYITEVSIVISPKPVEGITAELSLEIWDIYLKCEPNSKIKVYPSKTDTPVKDAYRFIDQNKNQSRFYIAGGMDEVDDQNYFQSFQKKFDDKVYVISVSEKHNRISATYVRKTLKDKDFERFKKTLPQGVINKGYAKEIYNKLIAVFVPEEDIFESKQTLSENNLDTFMKYACEMLEIEKIPTLQYLDNSLEDDSQPSFGGYSPNSNLIHICVQNRHPIDIMRTLAHELVHCKQNLIKGLNPNKDGKTGSEIENEAHAVAGMLMRDYAKKHPELF